MTGLPSTLQRPTFLGIGAQKCGTTWLHKLLSHHPGVFAANPKEIDFFSYGFDRGYEWYGRFFCGWRRPQRPRRDLALVLLPSGRP